MTNPYWYPCYIALTPAYPHDIPWKSLAKLMIHVAPHSCDNPQWTVDVKWVIDSSRPQGDSAFFRSLWFFAIRLCSLWCEIHFVVLRWLCFKFDWISSLLILWVWTMIVTMTWLRHQDCNQVIHWNWELQWVRPYTGKRLPNAHRIIAIWLWFVSSKRFSGFRQRVPFRWSEVAWLLLVRSPWSRACHIKWPESQVFA